MSSIRRGGGLNTCSPLQKRQNFGRNGPKSGKDPAAGILLMLILRARGPNEQNHEARLLRAEWLKRTDIQQYCRYRG
jgi:hypothetical protein